jgi:hypothetical protein
MWNTTSISHKIKIVKGVEGFAKLTLCYYKLGEKIEGVLKNQGFEGDRKSKIPLKLSKSGKKAFELSFPGKCKRA